MKLCLTYQGRAAFFVVLILLLSVFPTRSEADLEQLPITVFPIVAPRISGTFGMRVHPVSKAQRHHGGVDLAAPEDSYVRTVLSGRVVFAGLYAGYGNLITIEHAKGRATMYGHLKEINVRVGQEVSSGELIGRVGSTGISTGPHLHFEWRENGQSIDPRSIFPGLMARPEG